MVDDGANGAGSGRRMIEFPLAASGVLTRVLASGEKGTAVVFLHGMGARADRWRRNLEEVGAAGFRAYAVDLPGHGFAAKGENLEYSISAFGVFLAALLDVLEQRDAYLVGTSLGAHVCAHVASKAPERVRGLVLVGALGLLPVGVEARARMSASLADVSLEGTRTKLQRLVHDATLVTEEWIEEEHRINTSPGARSSFAKLGAYVAASSGLDADVCGPALQRVAATLPILLAWGSDDRTVPLSLGERAHAALPGSRFAVIGRAAHAPYLEQPGKFNRLVLDFLAESEAQLARTKRS